MSEKLNGSESSFYSFLFQALDDFLSKAHWKRIDTVTNIDKIYIDLDALDAEVENSDNETLMVTQKQKEVLLNMFADSINLIRKQDKFLVYPNKTVRPWITNCAITLCNCFIVNVKKVYILDFYDFKEQLVDIAAYIQNSNLVSPRPEDKMKFVKKLMFHVDYNVSDNPYLTFIRDMRSFYGK